MNYLKIVNPLSESEAGNYLEDKISIDVATFLLTTTSMKSNSLLYLYVYFP